jgi:hypothetical protein
VYFEIIILFPALIISKAYPAQLTDDFLDVYVTQRNLIVLDDLMAKSMKINESPICLQRGVITAICLQYIFFKTYFIKAKKPGTE